MSAEDRAVDLILTVAGPLLVVMLVMVGRWVLHVRDTVREIGTAINHRPAGEPNIYDLVKEGNVVAETTAARLAVHTADDEYNFADLRDRLAAIKEAQ